MLRILTILLFSTLGRKLIMALTGLGAIGFLVGHLSGNLIIYLGEEAFNAYAARLHSIPILPLIEMKLAGLFATHILFALWLTWDNWRARPHRYLRDDSAGARDISNTTMIWSGSVILLFMLLHVFGMKLGSLSGLAAYSKVWGTLADGFLASCYLIGILALGIHLFHGGKSILQTLGLRHPTYDFWVDLGGRAFAVIVALAFFTIPVYILIREGMGL